VLALLLALLAGGRGRRRGAAFVSGAGLDVVARLYAYEALGSICWDKTMQQQIPEHMPRAAGTGGDRTGGRRDRDGDDALRRPRAGDRSDPASFAVRDVRELRRK